MRIWHIQQGQLQNVQKSNISQLQILGLGGHGAPYLKGRQHEVLLVQNIFAEVFFYWFLHLVSSGSLGQLLAFTDNQPSFLTCLLFRFPLIELLIPLLLFDYWNYIMILVLLNKGIFKAFCSFFDDHNHNFSS